MKYLGENLCEISFPLGGIGSGSIGIAGNGNLIDWEIFNNSNKHSLNGYSHMAVRVLNKGKIVDARVLCGDTYKDFGGIEGEFGHGVSMFTMAGFPHFKQVEFDGKFPFAQIDYKDKNFPGKIQLLAYNPLIPLDSKNSSIPAGLFEYEIENTAETELEYQIAFSIKNPFNKTLNQSAKNSITLFDGENVQNNLTIATDCEFTQTNNYWYRGWWNNFYKDNIRGYWADFSSGKEFADRNYTDVGTGDTCTLIASSKIPAGKTAKFKFVLSWSIPYNRNSWNPAFDNSGKEIFWKNFYATIFETSKESAKYSLENWKELYEKTKQFTDVLYSVTADDSVKEAIGAGLSVLKSPTVLRLENGDLYGWEGLNHSGGSCEGTCQHVWSYAYACCYIFPDLEMSIRNNYLKYGTLNSGETVFRLPLPLDRGEFVNLFDGNGKKFRPCLDGQMGDVVKIYREWKLSGNNAWLKENWENIHKLVDFAWSDENECKWDMNKDGVLEGRQHHTLDIELFGPSAWLQGFYLAALKAASEMAENVGDEVRAKEYNAIFKSGYEYTKNNLFNGKYFIQKVDVTDKTILDGYNCDEIFWNDETNQINYQISEGCLIDQLCGQWHSDLCGLGNIFDKEQVKTAVYNIYINNYKKSLRDYVNPWRLFSVNDDGGAIICSYPKGTFKPANPIPYCEETMSGFEYVLAGLLYNNGYLTEGDDVVKTVRKRYDGARRNPWNDMECGSNYARSMASFAILPILSGFVADMSKKTITFNPKFRGDYFKGFWAVSTAWGVFEKNNNKIKITVISGKLPLREIKLTFVKTVDKVKIDGKYVDSLVFDEETVEKCIEIEVSEYEV